ncbi:MAG TPA: IS66 family transposase [Gemmatimonadaceae bacterium]|nr:IS66 family transposase [Gemmatimonadaceae bacterium]
MANRAGAVEVPGLTREAVVAATAEGPDAVYELIVSLITPLVDHISRLEAQISKDSHNSSKPPSSDSVRGQRHPKSLRGKSGKRPGGQPGHPGTTLEMSEAPSVILDHAATHCAVCGRELSHGLPASELEVVERRQVFDIVPARPEVTEHRLLRQRCSACGSWTCGEFPAGVRASVQYGPEILALSVYLTAGQFIPFKRASELLGVIAGQPVRVGMGGGISPATVEAAEERAARALLPLGEDIFGKLQRSHAVHFDETGCFVEKKLDWLHTASTRWLTHYTVHPKRGHEAMNAIGLLPSFHGTAVHDGWKAYNAEHFPCRHALCGVHLLRELTFVTEEASKKSEANKEQRGEKGEKGERKQKWWSAKFKQLLLGMKDSTDRARERGQRQLEPEVLRYYEQRYQALLQEGDLAEPPPGKAGRRGGPRVRTPGRNLVERLRAQRDAVLCFLYDFSVPFDNSEAERDLRMMKVDGKISGGFRTREGARHFATIRGYLNTARKQGHSALEALRDLFAGHPFQPAIALPE